MNKITEKLLEVISEVTAEQIADAKKKEIMSI